ncbi:outer membrane beta-barrel protein [Carboxylicivirga sp. M1479]|uniref:outer membrane beta-barrel protein n=1 Tax=Carboxylicivirga sp. M1479 TaxID=2594476 RepID=UPI0011781C46|nr:outer membrane beta-barrel protein [Carboxylicivirga sp. M1479]TRX70856.1 porin family protein [Carboxylicivirga sp. M1479]
MSHLLSLWKKTQIFLKRLNGKVKFQGLVFLKIKEFTFVNDCFQKGRNEEIGLFGQALLKSMMSCFLLLIGLLASAQYGNHDWYISPKISFADFSDRNNWDGYSISKVPPISVGVEKGVTDFLSLGSFIGISHDKYVNDTLSSNIHRYSDMVIGSGGMVHFAGWIEQWTDYSVFLGDWDIYAGFNVLFKWKSTNETDVWNEELMIFEDHKSDSFDMKLRPLMGVRYFVTDNFCMMLEIGYANMGLVTTGVTFRIPNQNY